MTNFGIIFLSSGRLPYLAATIQSLKSTAINFESKDVHIVVNFPGVNLDSIARKYPNFTIHAIDDSSHAGLIKFAFQKGSKYDYCLFIEEDWLFNKRLSDLDLFQAATLTKVRQVVFSKYRLGHELEDSSAWGSSKLLTNENGRECLILDTYFSLNPTIVRKQVLEEICNNFDWNQPNNSGPHLEINLNRFIGQRFGPTILISGDVNFNVTHIGLLTAKKNLELLNSNRSRSAEYRMQFHVLLLKFKNSNVLLRNVLVPHIITRFLES
jgi:hypothetical protein